MARKREKLSSTKQQNEGRYGTRGKKSVMVIVMEEDST